MTAITNTVLVSDMTAQVRVQSGLRKNQLFNDHQIEALLTDAYADFRDKVDARNAFWFKQTYPFTLTGGDGGNVLDLTLIPDLKEVQYVNRINGTVKTTVTALGSIAERNNWTNPAFGVAGRRYFVDGDTLEILSPQLAAGSYELVYTPQYEQLAAPQVRTFAVNPADIVSFDDDGFILENANFDEDRDTGADLLINWDSPNEGYNGHWTITGIHPGSTTWCFVGTVSHIGFTNPVTGADYIETYQPVGTRADLPFSMRPWAQYLVTHACIAIRTSRKQDTTELERKLAQLTARVVTATKTRTQGVQQAPITRRRRGYGGFGGSYQ